MQLQLDRGNSSDENKTLLAEMKEQIHAEHLRLEERLTRIFSEQLANYADGTRSVRFSTTIPQPRDHGVVLPTGGASVVLPTGAASCTPRSTLPTISPSNDSAGLTSRSACGSATPMSMSMTPKDGLFKKVSRPAAQGPFRDLSIGEQDMVMTAGQRSLFASYLESFHNHLEVACVPGDESRVRHLPFARKIVKSRYFEGTVAVLILLNAIFVAVDAHATLQFRIRSYKLRAEGLSEESSGQTTFQLVGILFLVVFSGELLLRFAAAGMQFFFAGDFRWNMFDLFLVTFSFISLLLEKSNNVSLTRLLRLVRLSKAIRAVRVLKYFHETRVMLNAVLNSILPLCWSFIFMFLVIFIFSVWMMVAITDYLDGQDGNMPEKDMDVIKTYFHSFPMTQLSLFMAVSGGKPWWDIGQIVIKQSPVWGLGYVFYVVLMFLGLRNIITGVFVAAAADMSKMDRETATVTEQTKRISAIRKLRKMFEDFDDDKSGWLSWREFEKHMGDEKVKAYLSALDINVTKARALFKLLDVNERETVSLDEFVMGCLRLKGQAKTLDVGTLMYEMRNLKQLLQYQWRSLRSSLRELDKQFAGQAMMLQESLSDLHNPTLPEDSWVDAPPLSGHLTL